MLNIEIWKPVPTLEQFYEVSNTGLIRNMRGKVLKPFINSSGYKVLKLTGRFGKENWLVHRAVALAHIPNPSNLPIVNHLNGNKEDCNASNLEWCTNSHNILHARKMGLNPYNKPTEGKKLGGNRKAKSSYFGVVWDSSRNKWQGKVVHNGKAYCMKRFDTELEAAAHYNKVCDEMGLDKPRNQLNA